MVQLNINMLIVGTDLIETKRMCDEERLMCIDRSITILVSEQDRLRKELHVSDRYHKPQIKPATK